MNSVVLLLVGLVILAIGYVVYGRKVRDWVAMNEDVEPPSVTCRDGVDYVPARHWTVLFGHHFASIAGAAPIIGPVIACLFWGWLPAVLWILFGGIFFGAVHDYMSLCFSLESGGRSVGEMSESVLGKSARIVFSVFLFLALILIVAVFAAVAGKTLATTPQVVLPTFGLIFVAMGVGVLLYRTSLPLLVDTLIGLALLALLIWMGWKFPVTLPVKDVAVAARIWTVILIVYGMTASILPVSLLLQPRDHLASGVLFVGMLLGFTGILVSHPQLHSPAFIAVRGAKGMLWPMLFVTIACGAISGFHSLVSSGTTSKQLPRMRDARVIGYGAMIMESMLSLLAVIAVAAGLYWTHDQLPAGSSGVLYPEVFKQGGWIKAFGEGYGALTRPFLGGMGMLIGITMLKTFVMTTLDSATRITRYLCGELLGDAFGWRWFKNRYVSTLFVGVASGWLALGNWKAIWPIFGSANQLIAAVVLIVSTAYLILQKRKWFFAAVPAVLVLVTTIAALVYQLIGFLQGASPRFFLAALAVLLIVLGMFVALSGIRVVFRELATQRKSGTPPEKEEQPA